MLQAVWDITIELAPWLILGAAFAGAMHALLPPGFTAKLLGGRGAVWKSVFAGIPLPLCSCAVIPVGIGLKRQGASDGASVAFLVATPQTGVDSILVTAGVLGWPLAIFKVATAMITGLVSGWFTDAIVEKKPTLPVIDTPGGSRRPESFAGKFRDGFDHADDLVKSIWKWIVIGVVLSAAITTWVPSDLLAGLGAYGGAAAMGAALVLSLPLYVCATASVPIAASLVAAGLPLGAAIVFLMAGPATNVATVGAVYRGLGARALTAYLSTIILGSLAGGWLFQAWFDSSGYTLNQVAPVHEHGHAAAWWETVAAAALIVWIGWCAVRDLAPTPQSDEHCHDPGGAGETTAKKPCCHGE